MGYVEDENKRKIIATINRQNPNLEKLFPGLNLNGLPYDTLEALGAGEISLSDLSGPEFKRIREYAVESAKQEKFLDQKEFSNVFELIQQQFPNLRSQYPNVDLNSLSENELERILHGDIIGVLGQPVMSILDKYNSQFEQEQQSLGKTSRARGYSMSPREARHAHSQRGRVPVTPGSAYKKGYTGKGGNH